MPLLVAGDIFDTSEGPVSVVNLVLKHLFSRRFTTYAIPGQHDLPFHNKDLLHTSAFGTLMEALPNHFINVDGKTISYVHPEGDGVRIQIHGFGYDQEVGMEGATQNFILQAQERLANRKVFSQNDKEINVALVHAFCYPSGSEYTIPGVSPRCASDRWQNAFRGYDFVIMGDHHDPFVEEVKSGNPLPTLVNCGGAFNRNSNEQGRPRVGYLLYTDKTVREVSLLSSVEEKWKEKTVETKVEEWGKVLEKLDNLSVENIDDIMRAYELTFKAQCDMVKAVMKEILKAVKERKR